MVHVTCMPLIVSSLLFLSCIGSSQAPKQRGALFSKVGELSKSADLAELPVRNGEASLAAVAREAYRNIDLGTTPTDEPVLAGSKPTLASFCPIPIEEAIVGCSFTTTEKTIPEMQFPHRCTAKEAVLDWETYEAIGHQSPDKKASPTYQVVAALHALYVAMGEQEFDKEFGKWDLHSLDASLAQDITNFARIEIEALELLSRIRQELCHGNVEQPGSLESTKSKADADQSKIGKGKLPKETPLCRKKMQFPRHETVGEAMESWNLYEQVRCRLPEHIGPDDEHLNFEYQVIYQPVEAFHELYTIMNRTEFDFEFDSTPLSPHIQARATDMINLAEAKIADLSLPQKLCGANRNRSRSSKGKSKTKAPASSGKHAGKGEAKDNGQGVQFPRHKTVGEAVANWEAFEDTRRRLPRKIKRNHPAEYEIRTYYRPIKAFRAIYDAMDADEFDKEFGGLSSEPYYKRSPVLLKLAHEKAKKLGLRTVRRDLAQIPRFPRCKTLGEAMRKWDEFEKILQELKSLGTSSAARNEKSSFYNPLLAFLPILKKLGGDEFDHRLGKVPLEPYKSSNKVLKNLVQSFWEEFQEDPSTTQIS